MYRLVTRNYTFEEGSMTGILEQLQLESLKKRRTDNRLKMLYNGLKGKTRLLLLFVTSSNVWRTSR